MRGGLCRCSQKTMGPSQEYIEGSFALNSYPLKAMQEIEYNGRCNVVCITYYYIRQPRLPRNYFRAILSTKYTTCCFYCAEATFFPTVQGPQQWETGNSSKHIHIPCPTHEKQPGTAKADTGLQYGRAANKALTPSRHVSCGVGYTPAIITIYPTWRLHQSRPGLAGYPLP